MKFTKMHGLGNDYLYVYCDETPEKIEELAVRYSERHFGAGADGIICILPSSVADFRMRVFNADGSEAAMCGNGIRCVGKYVHDRGHTGKTSLTVETPSGIKELDLSVEDGETVQVSVGMGTAVVGDPVVAHVSAGYAYDEPSRSFRASVADAEGIAVIPVDMGNPHAVIFVEDAQGAPVAEVGSAIERCEEFPDGVNVEFVQVVGESELRMRVWERGSGITMACGTGSCASVAAAVHAGLCQRGVPVTVHLDGGDLTVVLNEDDSVTMTGPARFVYDGTTID